MGSARSLLAWLRRRRAPIGDALLTVAVTTMVLVDLSFASDAIGVRPTDGWAVALSLLQTLPLLVRRHAPLPSLLVIILAVGVYYSLGYEVTDGTLATFVGVYTVAAYENRPRSLIGLGLLAVGMTWYWVARAEPFDPTTPVWIGLLGLLSWGMGEYVRARRTYTGQVEALAERLEAARVLEAREAVWQERSRLARELHDVIGHTVNVMLIQAGAARCALPSDPRQAEKALRSIETTGREALAELDRLLGILRIGDDQNDLPTSLPGLADLPALACRFEDSGLPVKISIQGERAALPRSLDHSAYRIVQEALTNTLRHAGSTTAHVAVRFDDSQLQLEVADRGRQRMPPTERVGGGRGLTGIRERVALYGGDLEVGPQPGGGFVVRCRIPVGADSS